MLMETATTSPAVYATMAQASAAVDSIIATASAVVDAATTTARPPWILTARGGKGGRGGANGHGTTETHALSAESRGD